MNLVAKDGSITQPSALMLNSEASHFDLRSGCAHSSSLPYQEGQAEARDFWAAKGLWRNDGQTPRLITQQHWCQVPTEGSSSTGRWEQGTGVTTLYSTEQIILGKDSVHSVYLLQYFYNLIWFLLTKGKLPPASMAVSNHGLHWHHLLFCHLPPSKIGIAGGLLWTFPCWWSPHWARELQQQGEDILSEARAWCTDSFLHDYCSSRSPAFSQSCLKGSQHSQRPWDAPCSNPPMGFIRAWSPLLLPWPRDIMKWHHPTFTTLRAAYWDWTITGGTKAISIQHHKPHSLCK